MPQLKITPKWANRFFYHKDGVLYNKTTRNNRAIKDDEAGHVGGHGYKHIRFGDVKYLVHRILYVMYYEKEIPKGLQIDHINGNKVDNRKENLRLVTNRENSYNITKAKGFYYSQKRKKFVAKIVYDGNNKTLGYYDTELDARASYLRAKEKFHIIEKR